MHAVDPKVKQILTLTMLSEGTPANPIQLFTSNSKGVLQPNATAISVNGTGVNPERVTKTGSDTIEIMVDPSDGELISTQWYDVQLPVGLVRDASFNQLEVPDDGHACQVR